MELFRGLAAAGAVLTLLAATLWLLRRQGFASLVRGRKAAARRLESMERLPLGPQHTLHLVRMGDTALLLAATPTGCALVRTLPCKELNGLPEVGL